MAQFDVYPNTSNQTKNAYPYILDVQNTLIENISTRIVIPLTVAKALKNQEMAKLTPKVTFAGKELFIMVPQIASIPANTLKKPIGTLVHLRDEIIAALDFAITGI